MSDIETKTGRGSAHPQGAAFERRFREAATRVLRRHGIAEDRLDAEIERLRQTAPSKRLPTVEELEKAFAAGADARRDFMLADLMVEASLSEQLTPPATATRRARGTRRRSRA